MAISTGILIFTLVIYCSSSAHGSRTIIATNVGTFVGATHTVSSLVNKETRSVSRFLGIPYAKPPIGEFRFSKPVPIGAINMEYNATYFRPHCIQTDFAYEYLQNMVESEDCLYLNIYKPSVVTGEKLPVMVYIHGGSFGVGGSDIYDGDRLSAFYDVIVVVINYRLNIFGFLSDGSKMTGNYGLWDMKLALQWIHDNIAAFEGDADAVTIFGNSAGGAAVLYQATQPSNKGLFQRVISQSGSMFSLWSYIRNPGDKFKKLVHRFKCERQTSSETIQCLRALRADELKHDRFDTYLPTVDGDFIKDPPLSFMSSTGKEAMDFFTGLDIIIGSASQDGALSLPYWRFVLTNDESNTYINTSIQNDMAQKATKTRLAETCGEVKSSDVEDLIELYSLDVPTDDFDVLMSRIIDMETDILTFVPAILVA